MTHQLQRLARGALPGGLALLAGCGGAVDPLGNGDPVAVAGEVSGYGYNRDYVFISPHGGEALAVPFAFRSVESEGQLERRARGWLARGATWERFLDEQARTSAAGGVWRVVPIGDLRVSAGGAAEIEALRFQQGERRLRLEIEAPLSQWNQGGDTRFRVLTGRLILGTETISGPVLELLRVEHAQGDEWPAAEDADMLFLASGDSIQLLLAAPASEGAERSAYAWLRTPRGERSLSRPEIRWAEMRPYQEARRDVPRRWSFRIPASGVQGEVDAAGQDVVLGPERGGRRAIEVRLTVEGWLEFDGRRYPVVGLIRHTQQ